MIRLWVKLLKIPQPQLYAGILVFATLGVYGCRRTPSTSPSRSPSASSAS